MDTSFFYHTSCFALYLWLCVFSQSSQINSFVLRIFCCNVLFSDSESNFLCNFFSLKVAEGLVQRDGDFLIRDSLSSPGNFVLTCQWKNTPQHFKINKTVLRLNEAYCRVQYQFELESFDTVPGLVRYYVGNRTPISKQSGAIIFQPINRTVPLRCLEEKYGVTPVQQKEPITPEGKTETAKRLSPAISSMQSLEQSIPRGNLWRYLTFAVLMEGNGVGVSVPGGGDVSYHLI